MCKRKGFTLVELLVVIGIIALLVSILLPALNSARRSANTVKCLTALKEIGNAFQLYSIDNKGWYPPSQYSPGTDTKYGTPYVVNSHSWPDGSGVGIYYFNYIAKYVTKKKIGTEGSDLTNGSGTTNEQMTRSVIWGCPAFDGYITGSGGGGGYNRVQTGYGMNGWPTFSPSFPDPTTGNILPPILEGSAAITGQASAKAQAFHRQVAWQRHGTERLLISDSIFWLVESTKPRTDGTYPGQVQLSASGAIYATNGTTVDWYRHGKYPTRLSTGFFAETGGKVGYNILYADGHAATASDKSESYKAARLRFPG